MCGGAGNMVYKRPSGPICGLKAIGGQEERWGFFFHVQRRLYPKEGGIYGLKVQCAMCSVQCAVCMCVYVHIACLYNGYGLRLGCRLQSLGLSLDKGGEGRGMIDYVYCYCWLYAVEQQEIGTWRERESL